MPSDRTKRSLSIGPRRLSTSALSLFLEHGDQRRDPLSQLEREWKKRRRRRGIEHHDTLDDDGIMTPHFEHRDHDHAHASNNIVRFANESNACAADDEQQSKQSSCCCGWGSGSWILAACFLLINLLIIFVSTHNTGASLSGFRLYEEAPIMAVQPSSPLGLREHIGVNFADNDEDPYGRRVVGSAGEQPTSRDGVFLPLSDDVLIAEHDAYCPCCGYSGLSFSKFNQRDNALCPQCSSLERHRIACNQFDAEILKPFQERATSTERARLLSDRDAKQGRQGRRDELGVKAAAHVQRAPLPPQPLPRQRVRLLHFGPHPVMANSLNEASHLVEHFQVDFLVAGYGYTGEVLRVDVQDIQFPTDTFDGVLIFHVLEHVHNDTQALLELSRVLKKDARMLFEVPCVHELATTVDCSHPMMSSEAARTERCGQKDHVRKYACRDVGILLAHSPFQCHLPYLSENALRVIAPTSKVDQYACVNKKQ